MKTGRAKLGLVKVHNVGWSKEIHDYMIGLIESYNFDAIDFLRAYKYGIDMQQTKHFLFTGLGSAYVGVTKERRERLEGFITLLDELTAPHDYI